VIAIFLGNLRKGEPCRIFGAGDQTRDYVYVGDVVRAVLAALGHRAAAVINVGTGIETSVSELYDACRAVAGSDAEAVLEPARPGELARSVLDMSLAERELGFKPETSLAAGLAATWAHFLAN
jgi:UDP-glucose 4-epimerase